ncbi:MAG: GTPase HflX [Lachnospiraceae bacterium]|nr:GTPase HflX [Lachnospiraceae bacterium]
MREDLILEGNEKEKVLLVGVNTGGEDDFEQSMKELESLAEACNMQVTGMITQSLETVNKALYIGTGKVEEVRSFAEDCEAELVIFEDTLSPSQLKNLEEELKLPVMDRTNLILDIFATRAKSREAKLQVETARLKYLLPRLVGMHAALSRQGGTSGSMSSRGAGEKKLELDRRKIEHRLSELEQELKAVSGERETQRKKRVRSKVPQVALVGYTNAGKSTLLNGMVDAYIKDTDKRVFEENMLFATLETAVRRIDNERNKPFFLADTVGFINKLPHGLVKAFRSTLEEVRNADLLLHVIDYADENYKKHIEVTKETLKELGAGDIPVIYVYNKADLCMADLPQIKENRIYMSAKRGDGIEALFDMILGNLYAENRKTAFLIPYDKGQIVSYLCENTEVLEQNYEENGVYLVVDCPKADMAKYEAYIVGQESERTER